MDKKSEKKPLKKKLQIQKDRVRELTAEELDDAQGGVGGTGISNCCTTRPTQPTC